MKLKIALIAFTFLTLSYNCNQGEEETQISSVPIINSGHPILGNWIRNSHSGQIRLNFKTSSSVDLDFGNDKTVEIISSFELNNDTIVVKDIEGPKCSGIGIYKVYLNEYYVSFDLIMDNCNDRIKAMMGFWVRPGYQEIIEELTKELENSPDPALNLTRGRVYLALGEVNKAKSDFDIYIESDTTNARAYINRAGTKFPYDFEGIIDDCDRAILLDSQNKNAYFLRGLAKYELGDKESACEDFHKAIQLGFTILQVAEYEKCSDIWKRAGMQFSK